MPNGADPETHAGSPTPAQAVPPGPARALTPAARRALAEAAERRASIDAKAAAITAEPEEGGRGGPEPVRYGDWEIGGRAVDF